MKVRVRLFGSVRDDLGTESIEIEVPSRITVDLFVTELKSKYKQLSGRKGPLLVAVNQNLGAPGTVINEGDEVAVFPMVSGG